jgi:putative acetyltransferase
VIAIAEESPLGADLGPLMARHRARMHEDTPPGSIHMMGAEALAAPGIRFFVLRKDGVPAGMAAFKRLSAADQAEVKSMHVLAELRGEGLAVALLSHVVAEARADGIARLWLETGAQPSFIDARRFYLREGFVECGPFEGYGPDPNSVFMAREI